MDRLRPLHAYLLATALVLVVLGVRVALDPFFNGYPGILLFSLPILAAAYYGGLRSGFMATFLACAASEYLLMLPLTPLAVVGASYRAVQLFLLIAGVTISLLAEGLHRARRGARDLADARERLEEALKSEAAISASAQQVAGLGTWDFDLGTGVLAWSAETHRIFGVAPGEFGGTYEAFLAYLHPDDVQRIRNLHAGKRLPLGATEAEYRIVRPDGTQRVILDRGQVVRDASGRATRRTGVVMDITDRTEALETQRRLGEETRRREHILSTMLGSISDFAYIFDLDGRVLFANKPLLDLWGMKLEDAVGKNCAELGYPAELAARLARQLREVMQTAGIVTDEMEYVSPSGKAGFYEYIFSPVVAADGTVEFVVGSTRDVTERKLHEIELAKANSALRRQTAELRVLFDLVPAMIWFKDTTGRIVHANQRAAHAVGLSIAEIEGRPTVEIYPRDADRYQADDLEVIATGVPKMGLIERLADPTGTEIWVEKDKVPYFDDEGKVVGVVVMAQDITERKRSEAQLRTAHHQLVEVSRLGGMAEVATELLHDVGNILNSVGVSAALVVENVRNSRASRMADVVALLREHRGDLGSYMTTDPQGQHVPEMLEALSREWVAQQQLLVTELGQLHGNVERIKKVVASQRTHAVATEIVESLAVDELVEDAVRLQQTVLSEQHVRVIRDFTAIPPILVVRHKAVGILVSLLINGRQACKQRDPESRCITLRIERHDRHVAIRVTDNGAGIPAESLVRIFAPGFTTKADARGYGLHSAALAAAELGGALEASSGGMDKGATFTLELPLRYAVAA